MLDIQGRVFSVRLGAQDHERELDGVETLIDTLNRTFAASAGVKALALLGEWEDMLQVWALPKDVARKLGRFEWFRPSPPGLAAALAKP